MNRLSFVLMAMLFVTASFAGCFGGDGGDSDDDGTKTPPVTGNKDNNTTGDNNTTPPKVLKAPLPVPKVQMSVYSEGEEVENQTGTVFNASRDANVTFRLDGSESTDPDGTVEAHSWIVKGPGGEFKIAGPQLEFSFAKLKPSEVGVYQATLKVLDNDNVLNSTTFYFVLNYNLVLTLAGMNGAGQDTCGAEDDQQGEAGGALPVGSAATVYPGTWKGHEITVGENATSINLSLEYAATQSQLVMRLLPAGSVATACGDALQTAGPAASPLAITHEGNLTAGTYIVRIDLDGAKMDGYTLNVGVNYTAPAAPVDDEAAAPPEEEA